MQQIKILAIESSCDETAAAVVLNGSTVLSDIVLSQIDLHKLYGGVVPEIASRQHIENINSVIKQALVKADVLLEDIDAIAVTYGPGLVGALLVGVAEAKAISFATQKPLIGVNHIEGHIAANYIENPQFQPPFLCLVVSGGHSHLVYVKDFGIYEVIGQTRDDAVGEAYDKVARALGLGYPGGPIIDKLALKGQLGAIKLPKSYLEEGSYDFSFSGIKSAVLNYINQQNMKNEMIAVNDVATAFQDSVTEVLVAKTIKAAKALGIQKVAIAGGVAANKGLRTRLAEACNHENLEYQFPSLQYCTDNAAMIGAAAYFEYIKSNFRDMTLNAVPNLKIGKHQ